MGGGVIRRLGSWVMAFRACMGLEDFGAAFAALEVLGFRGYSQHQNRRWMSYNTKVHCRIFV